jgi:hypothetical protein
MRFIIREFNELGFQSIKKDAKQTVKAAWHNGSIVITFRVSHVSGDNYMISATMCVGQLYTDADPIFCKTESVCDNIFETFKGLKKSLGYRKIDLEIQPTFSVSV